jgi:hypothetical protein
MPDIMLRHDDREARTRHGGKPTRIGIPPKRKGIAVRKHHIRLRRPLAAWLVPMIVAAGAVLGSASATSDPHEDGYQAVVRRTEYGIPQGLT